MAEKKSLLLRIDPALWADLESWAQDELRSINGQIEYLLRVAVQKRRGGEAAGDQKPSAPRSEKTGRDRQS
jgi:hypothetical protein